MTTFTVGKLFTGTNWLHNQTISLESGIVKSIAPSKNSPTIDLLIPPFIDLQLYGAGGYLFSEHPTSQTIEIIHSHCLGAGTIYFMPTLATNSIDVFCKGIKAVQDYWAQGGKGCIGLHLEGPWINPLKKGAHDASYIHSPSLNEVKELLQISTGVVKMITLAPEMCTKEVIDCLVENQIQVSAGHSAATYDEAISGFSKGIRCVTHLFNAMSPLQHRAPGLVGATLHDSLTMASIIPDGHHVDWSVISIAHRLMEDRLFVITDAVTDCHTGPYQHELKGDHYVANGVLSGSALTMLKAFNNLIQEVQLSVEDATNLCTVNPARAVGINNLLSPIQVGEKLQGISLNRKGKSFVLIQLYD